MLRLIVLFAVGLFAVIASPAERSSGGALDEIHRAFDAGEIEPLQAARRYLIAARRHRKDGSLASEAFFSAGVAYERLGRFRDASEAYLTVVSDYPETMWFMPSVDALMETGERMFEKSIPGGTHIEIRTAWRVFDALAGAGLPRADTAAAVYRRGVCSLVSRQSLEAEFDFKKVLEDYPLEPWKEKAYFKLGKIFAGRARQPSRDQSATMHAISHFKSFLETYPDGALAAEARREKNLLEERKAEHLFYVCDFYRRAGEPEAMDLYSLILTRDYPGTSWAELAAEKFKR